MSTASHPTADLPFKAAAFAAYAHRHGLRKDNRTPYVSHVFRVCLVVRHVFDFQEPEMLATALLHDTIEDTETDYDDILEEFGPGVAKWVAALTKNKGLPDDEREKEYCRRLAAADWQVKAIKLADMYDNIGDSEHRPLKARRKTLNRMRAYLEAIRPGLPAHVQPALHLVEKRLAELKAV